MGQETYRGQSNGEPIRIQLVARVASVLFAFTREAPSRSLDALATDLDINKPSLLRILRSLQHEGLVQRDGGHYSLGPRVLQLAEVFLGSISVRDVAQPYVEGLAKACGQTATLAILRDLEVIYIAIEHPQRDIGILGEIGQRYPAHATAVGKALLAFSDLDDLQSRLGVDGLERLTHRTIVDPNALLIELEKTRQRGYAIDDEERGIGIRCVAAPIYGHDGRPVASLSLSGPIFHMTNESIPDFADRLLGVTSAISEKLGYLAPVAAANG